VYRIYKNVWYTTVNWKPMIPSLNSSQLIIGKEIRRISIFGVVNELMFYRCITLLV